MTTDGMTPDGKGGSGSSRLGKGIAIGFVAGTVLLSVAVGIAAARKRAVAGGRGPSFEATHVAVGRDHACAVAKDGAVACWGSIDATIPATADKALDLASGDGFSIIRSAKTTTLVGKLEGYSPVHAAFVAAHGANACAVTDVGAIRCFGPGSAALEVKGLLTPPDGIAVGDGFSCVLASGEVSCAGRNDRGQLGVADRGATRGSPEVHGARAIGAGGATACATTADAIVCWGASPRGEAGTVADVAPPTTTPFEAPRAIAVGGGDTCAVGPDAVVACFGRNDVGQLGTGTRVDSAEPRSIAGLFGVVAISVGAGDDACAIQEDGATWCWGPNRTGVAGDGTRAPRGVPVRAKIASPP